MTIKQLKIIRNILIAIAYILFAIGWLNTFPLKQ